MATWVDVPEGSDFPLANLPYGIVSSGPHGRPHVGVAIGDHVLCLVSAASRGLLDGTLPGIDDPREVLDRPSLNLLMSLGRPSWQSLRARLTALLTDESVRVDVEACLVPRADVRLHLPVEVADYVDFYSSEHHATNVGRMFRPDGDALTPNWKHLPIGYHGRAGTVVVSGTDVARPNGQRRPPDAPEPLFGPSRRLDVEVEVGFVVGVPSALAEPVPSAAFADHVFGVVLVNDWSARDLQAWEYQPLGPFLAKSFATSISPWVVPLAALEAARVEGPEQIPEVLPYLQRAAPWGLDLDLSLALGGEVVSRPPFASMYWTADQQLAHLTVNGASLRTGDLYASGTVSGPERDQRGSFLELSWGGQEPLALASGREVTFLDDGDTVTIRATFPSVGGGRAGFGELTGTIVPATVA
jgi:fumarylacetoacetase